MGGDAGFTLVEALVALAVFAMAGVALVSLQAHSLRTLSQTELRALGSMVAQNELVEIAAARLPPDLGAREGEADFANRHWLWRLSVEATPDPLTRRVAIVVTEAATGAPAGQAVAFVAAPPEPAP